MSGEKRKELRRDVLVMLDAWDGWCRLETLVNQFDGEQTLGNIEAACHYLAAPSKAYVESEQTERDQRMPTRWRFKITPNGRDLLDGLIEIDPGIMDPRRF